MRLQCDKCPEKIQDADTSTAIAAMTKHYATHKGTSPKGTNKVKKE